MFTIARPPVIQPTQASARFRSFSEIPPEPIRTPIVIKNGTAIREKELMPLTICWLRVARGRPWYQRHRRAEIATEYAIWKRRKTIRRKLPIRISTAVVSIVAIIPRPPFLQVSQDRSQCAQE